VVVLGAVGGSAAVSRDEGNRSPLLADAFERVLTGQHTDSRARHRGSMQRPRKPAAFLLHMGLILTHRPRHLLIRLSDVAATLPFLILSGAGVAGLQVVLRSVGALIVLGTMWSHLQGRAGEGNCLSNQPAPASIRSGHGRGKC